MARRAFCVVHKSGSVRDSDQNRSDLVTRNWVLALVRAWEIEIHLSGAQVSALAAQRRNFSIYLLNLRRIPIDLSSLLVSVIAARPRSGEKNNNLPR